MSWKTRNCYPEDVFKTCPQGVVETKKMFTGKESISLSDKSISNKTRSEDSKAIPRKV